MIRTAVLQTSFLGDMVLTTPLLERVAREGPVTVVATPANAALLANHPAVHHLLVYDKRGADRGLAGLLRVARALRGTRSQRALLAQGSWRTATLARLAGISECIGFETSAGRLLYTRRLPYRRDLHHAVRLWQLGNAPGQAAVPDGALRPSLVLGASDHAVAEAFLAGAGIPAGAPLVALAPGSAWATKRWPYFPALASALLGRAPESTRLIVVGGADDRPLAEAIVAGTATRQGSDRIIDATARFSLLGSAALLGRCAVLVSNDSAPVHLASAMGTPTVALFGPTTPALGFGPLAPYAVSLQDETLPCRPCHAHGPVTCPLVHWQCMRQLDVTRVADAVLAALPRSGR